MSTPEHFEARRPERWRAAPFFLRLAAGSLLCCSLARADDTDIGRIEITGSRIPSIQDESSLPVQIIRREDIDRSGATNAEQLLDQISANNSAIRLAESVSSFSKQGMSGASLRGLGGRATLILVDGRRLSNYAFTTLLSNGVDLNSIPVDAIDRVEVLKDGASAIYGSDAVGGVINFILKRDFVGATASVQHGQAQHGGASETQASVLLGFGNLKQDRFNIFASLGYDRTSPLAASSRKFSANDYRPDLGIDETDIHHFPANIPVGDNLVNPSAPACSRDSVYEFGGCQTNDSSQTDSLPATERTNLFARARYRLTDDFELFNEVLYSRDRVRTRFSASPVSSFTVPGGNPIQFPASSPFFPQGLGLTGNTDDLYYQTLPLGQRTLQSVSEQARVLVGAQGQIAGWTYDTALSFNESRATNTLVSGFVSASAITSALGAGLINPFGDSGPAGDALLASTERRGIARRSTSIARGVDFSATRDLFNLPAGPLGVALGAEARHDSLNDAPGAILADLTAFGAVPPKVGGRSTEALYGELGVPIVRSLDAQIAVRGDHYSDFGTTTNPKVSLRWQPLSGLVLRGSYGTGFRAPALPELYTAQTDSTGFIADPIRCPATHTFRDCNAFIHVESGGNPDLRPEKSEQASAGIVLQPTSNATWSVDLWRLRLTQSILPVVTSYLFANEAAFDGTLILRGPADPATPGLPGPLQKIVLIAFNQGTVRTRGIDLAGTWHSDVSKFGSLQAKLTGTYVQNFERRLGSPQFINMRAIYAAGRVVPRWQHYLSLGWDIGPWTTSLNQSFQTGYQDANLDAFGDQRHVGVTGIWGAQLTYAGIKHVVVSLGVDNLFDRPPETSNVTDYFTTGYNPNISDPRGRVWYARLKTQWP